jgi:glycosyltransferase involved in cell wall biosynthesis
MKGMPLCILVESDVAFLKDLNDVSNDVFISYRRVDNYLDIGGQKWVTQFSGYLETALQHRLGDRDVKVYFDELDTHPNDDLTKLIAQARSSAIFIAVASRGYSHNASVAQQELEAFLASGRSDDCLFVVEILPLFDGDEYPPSLRGKTPMKFWATSPESRTPITLLPPEDPVRYRRMIHDLAEGIYRRLRELRGLDRSAPPGQAATAGRLLPQQPASSMSALQLGAISGTVMLAQTTDDLVEEREQVRSYLRQAGLTVLPSFDYPQGGEAFRTVVADDLRRSDLFVQLLGRVAGRKPQDLPEGYTSHQAEAAKATGIPILQWRNPTLRVEMILDESYRSLMTADTVIASGLESFKSEIISRLSKPSAPPAKIPPSVYIDAHEVDRAVAESIRDALRPRHVVALPVLKVPPEEARVDLEGNLKDSDAVIFVYGKVPVEWVRAHLRRFNRTMSSRDVPPKVVAVYCGPPPGKSDIAMDIPYVKLVRGEASADLQPLLALFTR